MGAIALINRAAVAKGERCLAYRVDPTPRRSFSVIAIAIGDGDVRISHQHVGIDLIALQVLGGMCEGGGHRVEHEGRDDEHGDGFGDGVRCVHGFLLSRFDADENRSAQCSSLLDL